VRPFCDAGLRTLAESRDLRRWIRFAVWPGGDRPGAYGTVSKATALLVRVVIVVLFLTVLAGSRGWTEVRIAALCVAAVAGVMSLVFAALYLRSRRRDLAR